MKYALFRKLLQAKIPIISNAARNFVISRNRKTFGGRSVDFPSVVTIELTNNCNAKCWMCPNPSLKRGRGYISKELFNKIIDECRSYAASGLLKRIGICGTGEPLLHKDFIIFARSMSHMAEQVLLSTNAVLMNNDIAQCVAECFTGVSISINASNPEDYAKVMGISSANFDKAIRNIDLLINTRERLRSNLNISLRLTNWDNLSFNSSKAVSDLRKKYSNSINSIECGQGFSWAGSIVNKDIPNKELLCMDSPCGYIFDYLEIQWNGGIGLCCQDAEGSVFKNSLNINNSSIHSIWHSDLFNHYRAAHVNGAISSLELCNNCIRYF